MECESRRLIDALPGLVWTALPDGQLEDLNERWGQYTALSAEDARGLGWQSAIFPGDLPPFLEQWKAIIAAGQPGDIDVRLRRFDAEYRWFRFRLAPLAERSGKVIQWCGVGTDIEDHKQTDATRTNERRLKEIINTIPTY